MSFDLFVKLYEDHWMITMPFSGQDAVSKEVWDKHFISKLTKPCGSAREIKPDVMNVIIDMQA